MSSINLPLIHFVGLVLELVIYGFYVIFFTGTVWVLGKRRRGGGADSISPVIDLCSWFIFVTLTIHVGTTVYFAYEGFILHASNPVLQLLYFANNTSTPNLIRSCMYGLVALGMESMLVYRVWVVWKRSWLVIILPIAIIIFEFIGFVMILCGESIHVNEVDHVTLRTLTPILFIFEALTNIICAGLIAARIIRESLRASSGGFGRGMQPVLWIIAESAAIYTVLTLIVAAGLIARQPMVLALMDVIPSIAGITSCLLIVRAGLGMAADSVHRSRLGTTRRDSVALKVSVTHHAVVSCDDGLTTVKEHDAEADDVESLHKDAPPRLTA